MSDIKYGFEIGVASEEAQSEIKKILDDLDKLKKGTGKINLNESVASFQNLNKVIEESNSGLIKMGEKMKSLGKAMSTYITAPLTLIAGLAVREFANAEKAQLQFTSALKNSGKALETTNEGFKDIAESLSKLSGFDDEQILTGVTQKLVLAENISEKMILRIQGTILDFSNQTGIALETIGDVVAKALSDPAKGLSQLERMGKQFGLNFSEDVTKGIEALVKSGKIVQAQELIIAKLEDRFKGASETIKGGFSGSLTSLKLELGNAMEEIGRVLAPAIQALANGIKSLVSAFRSMPDFMKVIIVAMGAFAASIGPVLVLIGQFMVFLPKIQLALGVLSGVFEVVAGVVAGFTAPIWALVAAIGALTIGFATSVVQAGSFSKGLDLFIERLKWLGNQGVLYLAKFTNLFLGLFGDKFDTSGIEKAIETNNKAINSLRGLNADVKVKTNPVIDDAEFKAKMAGYRAILDKEIPKLINENRKADYVSINLKVKEQELREQMKELIQTATKAGDLKALGAIETNIRIKVEAERVTQVTEQIGAFEKAVKNANAYADSLKENLNDAFNSTTIGQRIKEINDQIKFLGSDSSLYAKEKINELNLELSSLKNTDAFQRLQTNIKAISSSNLDSIVSRFSQMKSELNKIQGSVMTEDSKLKIIELQGKLSETYQKIVGPFKQDISGALQKVNEIGNLIETKGLTRIGAKVQLDQSAQEINTLRNNLMAAIGADSTGTLAVDLNPQVVALDQTIEKMNQLKNASDSLSNSQFGLRIQQEADKAWQALQSGDTYVNAAMNAVDGFANSLTDALFEAKDLGEALTQTFKNLAKEILNAILKAAILRTVSGIAGGAAEGGLITPAGVVRKFSYGGFVSGPGTTTSDSIPALLSNREFVMPAKAVEMFGVGFFEQLRSMSLRGFAQGGLVTAPQVPYMPIPGNVPTSQPMSVQIINNGTPQQVDRTQYDPSSGVLQVFVDDMKRGGPISQAMQGTFGLKR